VPLDPPLTALEDSALRRAQLVRLALAIPTSKEPVFDREYYYELRKAHRPHLTESDYAELREVEAHVGEVIDFRQEMIDRTAELRRRVEKRKAAADAEQERHNEFRVQLWKERHEREDVPLPNDGEDDDADENNA
jgi:hypothetical protein